MKSLTDFYLRSDTDRIVPRSSCKECCNAQSRQTYLADPEAAKKRNVAWEKANPDKVKAKSKRFYEKNKESILIKNREYHKDRERANRRHNSYRASHPGEDARRSAKRRAAKLRATPRWADEKLIAEFYETAAALSMITGEWYHVDHIVPLQSKLVCGFHSQHNLQVIEGQENFKKNNRRWPEMP